MGYKVPRKPRELSPLQQEVALYSQDLLGSEAEIYTFEAVDGSRELPILIVPDCPSPGLSTYSTIGYSDHPQPNYGSSLNLELIGACDTPITDFANVMTSCVIESLNNDRPINYGVVFWDIVSQYGISATLQHVTFVAPYFWEGFSKARLLDRDVHWLMVLPIAQSEMVYLKTHGVDALEKKLEESDLDFTDINREAAV